MSDEWMDHVRWSYVHRIRLMAQRHGFVLVRFPDYDPDTELEGYLEAEWGDEDAEPSLYLLLEQSTGKHLFPEGVTIGQIEDFLTERGAVGTVASTTLVCARYAPWLGPVADAHNPPG